MFYVREHAIDRYIERIEDVPRNVARNNILEVMLFPEKKAVKGNWTVYLSGKTIVVSVKEECNVMAITTMNIEKLDPEKDNWWQEILIDKENDDAFKKET